jgi:hypothetical protein
MLATSAGAIRAKRVNFKAALAPAFRAPQLPTFSRAACFVHRGDEGWQLAQRDFVGHVNRLRRYIILQNIGFTDIGPAPNLFQTKLYRRETDEQANERNRLRDTAYRGEDRAE